MGNPRLLYVADASRRPILDRGSPRRTHGNAVANPRIRVCQPSSRCPASYFAHQLHSLGFVSSDGKDIVMPNRLENEHKRASRPILNSGCLLWRAGAMSGIPSMPLGPDPNIQEMEARPGIEPGCKDLQSSASPLRHRAEVGRRCAGAGLVSTGQGKIAATVAWRGGNRTIQAAGTTSVLRD